MPIDEGWRLVKDAFQKSVAGGKFDYSLFPLRDLQAPAIGRVQTQAPAINPPGWLPAPPVAPGPAAVGT
jgi:hypothetical protein